MKIACQASAGLSVSARMSMARAVRIGCRVDDVNPVLALDAVGEYVLLVPSPTRL